MVYYTKFCPYAEREVKKLGVEFWLSTVLNYQKREENKNNEKTKQ